MSDHCGALCPFAGCADCPYPSANPIQGQGVLVDCEGIETPPASATNTDRRLTRTPTDTAGGDGL